MATGPMLMYMTISAVAYDSFCEMFRGRGAGVVGGLGQSKEWSRARKPAPVEPHGFGQGLRTVCHDVATKMGTLAAIGRACPTE